MINRPKPLDVAIIGAGPYGLSIAAHLQAAGIEHRVFGAPMETWQRHMPAGMCLKSYGESSNLFDVDAAFSLEAFTRAQGIDYHPSRCPVRLETFVAYGRAFQERFVPRVTSTRLVALRPAPHRHELCFDNGEALTARHVVIAVGVHPFKHTPSVLANLPADLVSHSGDHGPLAELLGKEIIIVGSGASALDLAALLSAQGSAVTLLTRSPTLHFQSYPSLAKRSFLQRVVAPNAQGLGAGWLLRACTSPRLIHKLPDQLRSVILSDTLGPSGGYFIREQVESAVRRKLGRVIEQINELGGRVQVRSVDHSGTRETISGDHLIAATGYRIDLRRLPFLAGEILLKLRTRGDAPILSESFESSIPGLYFVGLASARSFGPVMRFVVGAVHPARRLMRVLPKRLTTRRIWVSSPLPD